MHITVFFFLSHLQASLFALSSEVNFPRVDRCLPKKLAAVTFETKLYFSSFIDKLQRKKSKCLLVRCESMGYHIGSHFNNLPQLIKYTLVYNSSHFKWILILWLKILV